MNKLGPFVNSCRIAYFTMEAALQPQIHTYSGGLGILAGDTARSAADLEIPIVMVTLISRAGYLRQVIDEKGLQKEYPDPWEPAEWAHPLGAKIAVTIEGREVWVRPWLYTLEGVSGYQVPILLLDTDLDENSTKHREISNYLYGGDLGYRLKQEVVLGIGGVRILRTLGFEIYTYHLNEGHSALLALELLRKYYRIPKVISPGECHYDISRVKELCIFTTHTPVEAGHDRFPYSLVEDILGDYLDLEQLKLLSGNQELNMTRLALNLSGYVNGVARKHAQTAHALFPQYRMRAITNGVHPRTWTCKAMARLYDQYMPEWLCEPTELVKADQISDVQIWSAHQEAKQELINKVQELTGVVFNKQSCLLGFARRMTGYKRPDLLFKDLQRLRSIHRQFPIQIVLSGKAHPQDENGKALIMQLHQHIKELSNDIKIAFIPNYDMEIARYLVSGTDVWLNTPMPPMEASGTSGMKAAFNGVPQLSAADGWWLEGSLEGVTGWTVDTDTSKDPDRNNLYDKLETAVLPLFYQDPSRWIQLMKNVISKNTRFNSHRMMRRYAADAYLR